MKNIRKFLLNGVDSRYAKDFSDDYTLVTTSQDIEFIINHIGMEEDPLGTGSFMVLEGDGEYSEVWWSPYMIARNNTSYYLVYYQGKLLKR